MSAEHEPPPLSARSVALSLALGTHPEQLSPAALTGLGEHVGVPASTLRVALTRAVAAGDLCRIDGRYALGERLAARQRHQEEGVEDAETSWNGDWEMAVVVVTGRSVRDRVVLRDTLAAHRLGELREGVWTRPANLRRTPSYGQDSVLTTWRARPSEDPAELAGRLWDLDTWSDRGHGLLADLEGVADPGQRLAVAAQVVRHLGTDPLLPRALLPPTWPGDALRTAYAEYRDDLRALVAT